MLKSLLDLIRLALLFAVSWAALAGWGMAAGRLLNISWRQETAREEEILTGFFCLYLWGGLWNLRLPFALLSAVFFTGIGVLFFAFLTQKGDKRPADWLFLPVILLFLSFAMGEIQVGDSLSYHCDTIRWINGYAAVPGLANLHSRLGFNQFYFYWPAFCEAWLPGLGWSAANPFLGLLTAAYCWKLRNVPRFGWLGALALGGAAAYSFRGFLASPAPDAASTFWQLTLMTAFVREIADRQPGRFPFFVLFCVTLMLTKLANLVTAGSVLVILFTFETEKKKVFLTAAWPALLLIGVWMTRSVILSGCFIYPLPWPTLNVEWLLPAGQLTEERLAITGWARLPGEAYRSAVTGPWSGWFGAWCQLRGREMLAELLLIVIAAAAWFAKGEKKRGRLLALSLLPAITGLGFWFVTAPDPRFVRGILMAAAFLPAAEVLNRYSCRRWTYLLAAGAAFFILLPYPPSGNSFRHLLQGGAAPRPPVPVEMVQSRSGLPVTLTGREGSPLKLPRPPLPATPQFDPDLALRGKTLQEGFVLRPAAAPQKRSK